MSWIAKILTTKKTARKVDKLTTQLENYSKAFMQCLKNTIVVDGLETGINQIYLYIFISVIIARAYVYPYDKDKEIVSSYFLSNFANDMSKQHKIEIDKIYNEINYIDSCLSIGLNGIFFVMNPVSNARGDIDGVFDIIGNFFIENNYLNHSIIKSNKILCGDIKNAIRAMIISIIKENNN